MAAGTRTAEGASTSRQMRTHADREGCAHLRCYYEGSDASADADGCGDDVDGEGAPVVGVGLVEAAAALRSRASRTRTRMRMPSQPRRSGRVLRTYSSMPPYYPQMKPNATHQLRTHNAHWPSTRPVHSARPRQQRTLLIVLSARAVSFTRTFSPRAAEKRRLGWTLGSQVRRVFFLEKGTLLPYCFVLPWKRPSCARLKGPVRACASDGRDGNIVGERGGREGWGVEDGGDGEERKVEEGDWGQNGVELVRETGPIGESRAGGIGGRSPRRWTLSDR